MTRSILDAANEPFSTGIGPPSLDTIVGISAIGGFLLRGVPTKIDEFAPPAC